MYEIKVFGVVQGVGFRPYIYNNAVKFNIKGLVKNTEFGVLIICNKKKLMLKILKSTPSQAKIEKIEVKKISLNVNFSSFKILKSTNKNNYVPIPSDLNLCSKCLKELYNLKNRRYFYPFISCTNCGPRYSIIYDLPYDREKTSFKKFNMCDECEKEYRDSNDRRFHSQTNCCYKCGPKLKLYENNVQIKTNNTKELFLKISKILENEEVVAIKGVGGFHLVCKIKAAKKLKNIVNRKYKPFALMAKNFEMIEKYAKANRFEKNILESQIRPIVLLDKKEKNSLIEISELSSLGFMLPYTPIHYLLFNYMDEPLIFTSSNLPSRPITTKKNEQFVKYVVDYNREIVNSLDDSIIKVINNKPIIIRRSRGFALKEIQITSNFLIETEDIISVGSELKNTLCIKKKNKLIISEHIGNTFNLENFENFKYKFNKLTKFTNITPKIIICDKNSLFNTSSFAESFANKNKLKKIEIQHHIAHAFGVAIEYNLDNFISIICDGSGLGLDNSVWGGEVFYNDKRIGHLEKQILIGGDLANKEPVRMLVGILSKFMNFEEIVSLNLPIKKNEISIFLKQKKENFNCIETSSCGRILDCASILLGFTDKNYYEGRGAMVLESKSSFKTKLFIKPVIKNNILMTTPLFKFLVKNINKISKGELARFVQIYLSKGLFQIAKSFQKNKEKIVFGGGCAYNKIMSSYMLNQGVLLNKNIPPGDGGISLGQIAYYLWKLKNNSVKENNA